MNRLRQLTTLAERISKIAVLFILQDQKSDKGAAHKGGDKRQKHPKPCVSHEKSRSQYLVRVPGAKSQSFGYTGGQGAQKKACSLAWACLVEKCRTVGLDPPKKATEGSPERLQFERRCVGRAAHVGAA